MAGSCGRPSGRPGRARCRKHTQFCVRYARVANRPFGSRHFRLVVDTEGYGERPGQTPVDRLIEDCRTLSPAGVERVAHGWDQRASSGDFADAERAALRTIEGTDRGDAWDALRNQLLGLTERGQPLIAWRLEHGSIGHKAEDALIAAALALSAGDGLDVAHRQTLLRPMSEALPWLGAAPADA